MTLQVHMKSSFLPEEISAIAELERVCNAAEQIEIKAGVESLPQRPTEGIWDILCYSEEKLIGYLCFYTFDGFVAEVISMVHPKHRRRGVFRAMLNTALAELRRCGIQQVLYVVPAPSQSGLGLMKHLGTEFHEAEYSMHWAREPQAFARNPHLHLSAAGPEDFEFLVRCASQAFEDPEEITRNMLHRTNTPDRTSYLALHEGTPVGMLRVQRIGTDHAAVFCFAVLPEQQGHGYGRQILTQCVELLRQEGRTQIELEVVTENERGLHLYTTSGFDILSAYRYYKKPL
ncbi:GNAT family N-acetyltransferase [Tumebacillus permanentifrigoris]|uniref:Ribosomal protein S18 acetylase RimI-like enzyme n=1 Tax=Tumebacillus permanentifrigoris TaxID=378543 RepID=A0A316D521_9BACL|nr:GNAT family N-acetyltransferase [Tumebacillus permanentifrigoris]PWK07417.1 ribosomal protein S18 acetylase RimI-like enzyme [Tumebacillus permanentifrigoris]